MKLLPESPVEFLDPLSRPPESLYVAGVEGPFVTIVLAGTERGLVFARRDMTLEDFSHDLYVEWGIRTIRNDAPLRRWIERYGAYFDGDRGPFGAVLQPFKASPFTIEVHRCLTRIPFGATLSYGDVAAAIGKPGSARAVGNACGKNRTLIVVPCHRVVASNGIGGFGAGLHVKKRLLEFEGIGHFL